MSDKSSRGEWKRDANGNITPRDGEPVSIGQVNVGSHETINEMEMGSVDFGSISADSTSTATVTFASAFSSTPNVLATPGRSGDGNVIGASHVTAAVQGIDTNDFVYFVNNQDSGSVTVDHAGWWATK